MSNLRDLEDFFDDVPLVTVQCRECGGPMQVPALLAAKAGAADFFHRSLGDCDAYQRQVDYHYYLRWVARREREIGFAFIKARALYHRLALGLDDRPPVAPRTTARRGHVANGRERFRGLV